ncbi:tyrosine-type recombinase/integrase [Ammoniphilus sp. 3BR4]|uniref:tyrosine-type recombinase/integrase n=1 Tax=Ammoniphilus sp. 3BR4 TaxID=3158265 RepID=UPI003466DD36
MIKTSHELYYEYEPIRKKIKEYVESELMGKTQDTQITYYYTIEKFMEFLFLNGFENLPQFTEKEINAYYHRLYDEKKSSFYINRTFYPISSFARFMDIKLEKKKVALPKAEDLRDIQPRSLEDERVEQLENFLYLELKKQQDKAAKSLLFCTGKIRDKFRNYVLYRLMVQCGLRISEAINLDIEDVVLDGKREESRFLHVHQGKGRKPRKIPIPMDLKHVLADYIQFREEKDKQIEFEKYYFDWINNRLVVTENMFSVEQQERLTQLKSEIDIIDNQHFGGKIDRKERNQKVFPLFLELRSIEYKALLQWVDYNYVPLKALFVSNRGQRVKSNSMMKMFKSIGIKSHSLRHTAIKRMVDSNVPINQIQAFSGHKTADMVLRYSKPRFEEIVETVDTYQRKFERKKLT